MLHRVSEMVPFNDSARKSVKLIRGAQEV